MEKGFSTKLVKKLEDVKIILSGLWISLMLTYLLGDVLRIFAGDFQPGEIEGTPMTKKMLINLLRAVNATSAMSESGIDLYYL